MSFTIKQKLSIDTVLSICLLAAICILGVRNIFIIGKSANKISIKSLELSSVSDLSLSFQRLLMPVNDYLIHGGKDEIKKFERILKTTKNKFSKSRELIDSVKGKEVFEIFEQKFGQVIFLANEILKLDNPTLNPFGAIKMEEMDRLADNAIDKISIILKINNKSMMESLESANTVKKHAIWLTTVLGVFFIFIKTAGGYTLVKSITGPIKRLKQMASKVAEGNLSVKTEIGTKDEIGELSLFFNKMTDSLQKITVSRDSYAEEVEKRRVAEEKVILNNQQLTANNQQLRATEQQLKATNQQLNANNQQLRATEQQLKASNQQLKAKEEELTISSKEWETTFNAIVDPISIHDKNHRIIKFNSAFVKKFCDKKDNILGKFCFEIVHNLKEPIENCPHTQSMKSRKPSSIEHFEPYMNCFLNISTAPVFNHNKKIFGSVHIASDITKRKEIEKSLHIAKEKADCANQAKSEFLANMSHEIRTPMNAIIGFSELLSDTPMDKEQKHFINTIQESGHLLLTLINDILDMSKIEAKELVIEKIDFNMEYIVNSVINIIKPKLKDREISISYNYDANTPKDFSGDPTRIRQIFLNLLSNAEKFTDKGKIFIDITQLDASEKKREDDDRLLQIAVHDTGAGIPKEKQKVIFQPFTQADTSVNRVYGGTGLGLAITKHLVEKMGGNICLESEYGKGSSFIFTLNLKEVTPVIERDITPIRQNQLNSKKILIVDDNSKNCELLDQYCKKEKMTVLDRFYSAGEALEWLSSSPELPDIIFCDIIMPDINGHEFTNRIKKDDNLSNVKLIALSSDALPGKARIAMESGFDAFIPKPLKRDDVIKIIQTVLGDNRTNGQIVTKHMAQEFCCKGLKILSVEDNPVNQNLLERLLKKIGCDVEMAFNGAEAVEKAKNNKYDLIIMDLQMPVLGGIDATKIIRGSINKGIPIIALTASAMGKDRDKCFDVGMNDFLPKPVNFQLLKEKILKWGYN